MKRILILDENPETVARLTKNLLPEQYSVQVAEGPDAALRRLKAWKPHVLIVGATRDSNVEGSGLGFISKFRSSTAGWDDQTAVLLVSDDVTIEELNLAMDQGVDGFLRRMFEPKEFVASLSSMIKFKDLRDSFRRASHRVEELSSVDDLTGLMNMRAAYRRADEEIMRSRRSGKSVSAIMLNLDGFSAVNQSYGFMTGSVILQEVAKRVRHTLRYGDLVARVGADEFFVCLPETDIDGAREVAEAIRSAIQSSPFKSERSSIRLTASLGVGSLGTDQIHQKMSDLLHVTSEALRTAKGEGPNHIEAYSVDS